MILEFCSESARIHLAAIYWTAQLVTIIISLCTFVMSWTAIHCVSRRRLNNPVTPGATRQDRRGGLKGNSSKKFSSGFRFCSVNILGKLVDIFQSHSDSFCHGVIIGFSHCQHWGWRWVQIWSHWDWGSGACRRVKSRVQWFIFGWRFHQWSCQATLVRGGLKWGYRGAGIFHDKCLVDWRHTVVSTNNGSFLTGTCVAGAGGAFQNTVDVFQMFRAVTWKSDNDLFGLIHMDNSVKIR